MFDWARGSMLKKLIDAQLYRADWNQLNAHWLKNWHAPWFVGLTELTAEMRVLDVGSSMPAFMTYLHRAWGCEVHALDVPESGSRSDNSNVHFGFGGVAHKLHPDVTMHFGFAGDDLLPAESFDLVTCISTLEHTYDHHSPVEAGRPMAHLNALRDLVRMLKPGGVLFMNWDIFLDMMPQHVGWDYEADFQILKSCGLELLTNRRRLRSASYLYHHPDSLFFDQGAVLRFPYAKPVRATAINMLWRKPGGETRLRFAPRAELEELYFPPDETQDETKPVVATALSSAEIDDRFRSLISRITTVLGRTDVCSAGTIQRRATS